MPDWLRQVLNDALHVLWGAAFPTLPWLALERPEPISALFLLWAVLIALVHASIIEFVKETPDSLDTLRDLAGYALGGLLGGVAVLLGS